MEKFIRFYRLLIYSILLLFFGLGVAVAQKNAPKPDFEADVLLVKLKPEYSDLFRDKTSIDLLKEFIAPVQLNSYTKTFPGAAPPGKPDHTDLTSIYTLTFSNSKKEELPNLAKQLHGYGYFEYVELDYIHQQQTYFYPNDPAVTGANQNYLGRMQAYEAWAIEQGNPNVVIGIVDTGVNYLHNDIKNNIAYNLADPINGVDDDGDGYIDNYQGWDLANNDNDPNVSSSAVHGANVAGIAAATVNNGLGGAGIAYHSKILPVKASLDGGNGALIKGYEGIIYAAEHGCSVMNLSWGGPGNYSSLEQDVINYAAINKDVLIVAAAGNTDEEVNYYPAAYDNVLSVIAMDTMYSAAADKYIDVRANFTNWFCCYKSTYARSVDIGAQGMNLYTTNTGNSYTLQDGSSAATPVVAGAAAIVRSHFPAISALQAAELLRVTADVVDTFPENALYKEKMGKGRINIYKALTDTKSPAIRFKNLTTTSQFNSETLFKGDTVSVKADFFNYLSPTSNLLIDISSSSSDIHVVSNSISLGVIDSLQSKSNAANPLTFVIKNTSTNDQRIEIRMGYTDITTGYTDYQYCYILVNPAYTTIYTDEVATTITSNGRTGFQDINSTIGIGFKKNSTNILYEAGLMIGQSNTKVSDCVRGFPIGNSNMDFKSLQTPSFEASPVKYKEVLSSFNDSATSNSTIQGIECIQRSYTFNTPALKNAVFLEYKIINHSTADIDSVYVGQFIDWDIQNYESNRTGYDIDTHLGYAYDITQNNLYAGISLLTENQSNYYAMDNSSVGGDNINPNAGFTKADKFKSLSSEIGRSIAGGTSGGNDISMTLAGRINHLKSGDTTVIAFALLASNTTLLDLKLLAAAAKNKFIEIHTGTPPLNDSYRLCTNTTADVAIIPSPGQQFNFYTTEPTTTSTPVYSGHTYALTNVSKADTVYITNADSLYQSAFSRYIIRADEAPVANFTYIAHDVLAPATFTNESIRYQSIFWNFGDGSTSTDVNPNHIYTTPGDYIVTLKASDDSACIDSIKHTVTISTPLGISSGYTTAGIYLYPNPVQSILYINAEALELTTADIIVFNAMGQVVLKKENVLLANSILQLDVAALSSGLYFIELKDTNTLLRFVK